MTDQTQMETLMKEIHQNIRQLWDTLMGLEMELVDQLEVREGNVSIFLVLYPCKPCLSLGGVFILCLLEQILNDCRKELRDCDCYA